MITKHIYKIKVTFFAKKYICTCEYGLIIQDGEIGVEDDGWQSKGDGDISEYRRSYAFDFLQGFGSQNVVNPCSHSSNK